MINKIIKFIVTGCYVGLIRLAPGTFGSLLAFPIFILILNLSIKYKLRFSISSLPPMQQELLTVAILIILVCVILFILGIFLVDKYIIQVGREDPKEVVIDEIVGQMLTVILSAPICVFAHNSFLVDKISPNMIDFIFLFLLPFVLFRFFDIYKPWPINWLDKNVKGGLGVMIDDVLAAIFASVMCYALTFAFLGDQINA